MKTLILAAIRCSLMFTAVTASLFCIRPAQAYIITMDQVGSDVVVAGSGAINLIGLNFRFHGIGLTPGILPDFATIAMGPSNPFVNLDTYNGLPDQGVLGWGKSCSTPTLAAETHSFWRPLTLSSRGRWDCQQAMSPVMLSRVA